MYSSLGVRKLDYIDEEETRKCVHRSLNRGESYHQLRSAIAKVSSRKLIGKNKIELIINNDCVRLLAISFIIHRYYLEYMNIVKTMEC